MGDLVIGDLVCWDLVPASPFGHRIARWEKKQRAGGGTRQYLWPPCSHGQHISPSSPSPRNRFTVLRGLEREMG